MKQRAHIWSYTKTGKFDSGAKVNSIEKDGLFKNSAWNCGYAYEQTNYPLTFSQKLIQTEL